jgi:hypothetical protein
MTAIRLAIATAFLTATLGACSRSDEPTASTGAGNALLDYVPADTPYLVANLEPLPEDVIDAYLLRLQPVIDEMQKQLSAARADLEAQQADGAAPAADDPAARLALALLRELDGKLSRAGLSGLGLDIVSNKVAYGMGAFPVLRMGLSDPEALRATIQRVLAEAGIPAPEQTLQGVNYWRVAASDAGDPPVGLYLSILSDQLAVGILPPALEAEMLPAFLGLDMPAGSDARTRLAELNRTHGYMPYGSAILDLHRLADQFLQADSVTARVMAAAGEYDPATLDAECVNEIHEIIDNAPLMTAGTTEFSTTAIAYQYRVESPATLAGQLMQLVWALPAAEGRSDRMLELSFGMRLGAVRDFLREKAMAITADPYLCEQLQQLNTSAEQALAQLDQPMPPFVNNFRGLRVSLNTIAFDQDSMPSEARGHLALHVEQPEMFVGMAQMFLPDLSELALTPGSDPVRLPASLVPVPDLVAFAAMSKDAIGLSVGAGEEASLQPFLNRKPGPEGMFLSLNYDTAAYLDYTAKLEASLQGPDDDAYDGDMVHAAHAVGTAARGAFRDMVDRSLTTMQFGPDGLVLDERMTFKP